MKRVIGFRRKIMDFIATNLTSIGCVYKEKIVKNDSQRRTQRPYKFGKMQHSTRIVKNLFNSKQIIQI